MRALNPHLGAYLELDGGERLGVRAAVAEPKASWSPGGWPPRPGRCGWGAREGVAAARAGAAARAAPDGCRRVPARALGAAARGVSDAGRGRARRAAYEVLRRVFEQDAWADRAFAAAAERHGLDPPRASAGPAPRLRRGAAARHRRPPDRGARRAPGGSSSIRLCWPRCAWASTSCSVLGATPDHAAVDQAVELAKSAVEAGGRRRRGRRRGGARERRAAPGGARAGRPARRARRRDARRGRRSPLLPRVAGRDVVGGARARERSLADGGDERAGGDRPARQRAEGGPRPGPWRRSSAAEDGVERPAAVAPLASPEAMVVRVALGDGLRKRLGCRRARRPGARLAGRGRGARPAARRAGAGPLRGARDEDAPRSPPG